MPFPFFCYTIFSLLFLSLSSFPAKITATATAPLTVLTANDAATWRDFTRFLDLQKGAEVAGVATLKSYFHRFGYLPPPPENSSFSDVFDASLETAVLTYQSNLGLPVTGQLDSDTISVIVSPRCGVADGGGGHGAEKLRTTKRYAYFYGEPRWTKPPPMTLTYAFSEDHMIDYLSSDEIRSVFRRSFLRWSKVIPVNFTESDSYETADVKIGFYRGDHGDGEPFDGVLGVLAHAFSPENGRFHLDGAETWAVDFESQKSKVAVDLESVVTHEIGHVLGLAHSKVKDAIMYPSLSPRSKKTELRIDDVEGVQALYGSNPNFKFSSLLASEETTSNRGFGLRIGLGSGWWSHALTIVLLAFWSL